MRPYGKGKFRNMDNTKLGIKVDDLYQKSEEVSGWKMYMKEHTENSECFNTHVEISYHFPCVFHLETLHFFGKY